MNQDKQINEAKWKNLRYVFLVGLWVSTPAIFVGRFTNLLWLEISASFLTPTLALLATIYTNKINGITGGRVKAIEDYIHEGKGIGYITLFPSGHADSGKLSVLFTQVNDEPISGLKIYIYERIFGLDIRHPDFEPNATNHFLPTYFGEIKGKLGERLGDGKHLEIYFSAKGQEWVQDYHYIVTEHWESGYFAEQRIKLYSGKSVSGTLLYQLPPP